MVSIEDVARKAGVSKTTVSHALSGRRRVAEETKRKVYKVIRELNYVPNSVARNLVSGKSNILGVVYPLAGGFFSIDVTAEFVLAAAKKVNDYGYDFLLSTKPDCREIIRLVRGGHVDGLIVMDVQMEDERIQFLKRENFPFVMIGRCRDNTGIDFVDVDAYTGVYEATKHLIHLGHQYIGLITILPHDFGFSTRARWGHKQALRDSGLPFNDELVVNFRDDEQAGYQAMSTLLARRPDCTACVVVSDRMLVGVLRYCEENGIKIPDNLSVVGMGSSYYQSLLRPPITSIETPAREMSRRAVEIMVSRINGEGEGTPCQVVLKPQIILRQSTAPPG